MSINPKEILQDLLSGWTVVNSIGVGGFKEVFLVENDSRKEALKITQYFDPVPSGSIDPDELETMLRARTEREYNLLMDFGGGCVVSLGSIPIQEREVAGHRYGFYSEEYLPGKTLDNVNLDNRSAGNIPDPKQVKSVFRTGLKVIERIWTKKIVHRDIKPLNIMITGLKKRPVVFFDLGIAFDRSGTSLTAQSLGPGTLRYRAPETLDPDYRSSIDFRCDLFSLAVTVYEFAVGFHPIHHGSMSDGETVYRLLKKAAEPLYIHRPDLGTDFCVLIDKCLHKAPALRPNRLIELNRILED